MQRRTALKNIGLSLGGLTLTPTVASLLQSCQQTSASWTPSVLSIDDYSFLTEVVDVILPATPNVPGAKDLNLMIFIDGYLDKVAAEEEKAQFLLGAEIFAQVAKTEAAKDATSALTRKDIDGVLASYFRAAPQVREGRNQALMDYFEAIGKGETTEVPAEGAVQGFLDNLRSVSLFAFKTNAIIGKEHLAYAPVPGQQVGCIDLEEATSGKAWAL